MTDPQCAPDVPASTKQPLISFVIPTFRRDKLLRRAVLSVLEQTVESVEVVVVDNGASFDVGRALADLRDTRIRIVRLPENAFFCRAVNLGIRSSRGQFIATLNDDAWIDRTWAQGVAAIFADSVKVGSVASLILSEVHPGLVDSAGNHVDVTGLAANRWWGEPAGVASRSTTNVFGPSSACAVYRRDALDSVGLLDDDLTAYFEDVDLSFRLQLAGYESVFSPTCRGFHRGSATRRARFRNDFLIERNRVWNYVKNMPRRLIRRYAPEVFSALSRPTPLHHGVSRGAFLMGRSAALRRLPHMWAKRRIAEAATAADIDRLEYLLRAEPVRVCRL